MKFTITEKKENPLLQRLEVRGSVEFAKETPSNVDVRSAIAKNTGSDESLVVVKHILTKFSHRVADFDGVVYKNLEAKNKNEMMTKHLKKQAEEGAKKAADAKKKAEEEAAKAKEEKAEEKKEDAAPETPTEEEKPDTESQEAPAEEKSEEAAPEPKEEKSESSEEKKEEGDA